MFGHHLQNSNVLFKTDNSAVKDIINNQTSKNKFVMKLITFQGHARNAGDPSDAPYPNTNTTLPLARELQSRVVQDITAGLSQNAQKVYNRAWDRFQDFMKTKLGFHKQTASPQEMAWYVAFLHSQGLKSTTIRTHLSAIGFMHELAGQTNPTQGFATRRLITAYKKLDASPPERKPITAKLLNQINKSLKHVTPSKYDQSLYSCLFSFMYHAALRASEVISTPRTSHALQSHHVAIYKRNNLSIHFQSFKHKKDKTPTLILHSTGTDTCPVKTYNHYILQRGAESGLLFQLKHGHPLKR